MFFILDTTTFFVATQLSIMNPEAHLASAHKLLIIESRKNDFGKIIQRVSPKKIIKKTRMSSNNT